MPRLKVSITNNRVIKSGPSKNGKGNWSLYEYELAHPVNVDGELFNKFTSFNGHPHAEIELDLEVRVNGQWKNLSETNAKSKLQIKFDEIERRLNQIESILNRGVVQKPVDSVVAPVAPVKKNEQFFPKPADSRPIVQGMGQVPVIEIEDDILVISEDDLFGDIT